MMKSAGYGLVGTVGYQSLINADPLSRVTLLFGLLSLLGALYIAPYGEKA
jgi:hypothetical protein